MTALVPTLTLAGLNAVFNAQGDGLQARITHIVLGDQGRTPSPSHTSLGNQRRRIPIADGEKTADRQLPPSSPRSCSHADACLPVRSG